MQLALLTVFASVLSRPCGAVTVICELDRLENISSPTCIVVGDQDVVTPAYFSEELKQHIAHRELHVISGAGHSVHAEKPEAFFAIVRDFIERLTAC